MKVLIWIHKDDIITGKIKEHYFQCPQAGWQEYVQVEITTNEFAKLQDDKYRADTEMTKLEDRIYNESQKITGGDFEQWYKGLSPIERHAYKTVFGH
tara:strand:- start:263 stop:553 length:291 start_codon:yes stop_codon:yes gene_type:complete